MAGLWRWSVESKDFELLIKGGVLGARIFERNNRKQRSIFMQNDELAWLACTVEELVAMENSDVFWDQSRVGYPRIIAHKCSNRHGCFLTVEEFDGRRRCGLIMVLEGQYGQGWEHFILEVCRANSSLRKVREVRECKKVKEVTRMRSYAEVLGLSLQPAEDYFNSFQRPITRVPRWLKEASIEMDKQAHEAKKLALSYKNVRIPARSSDRYTVVPKKTHTQAKVIRGSVEK